MNTFTGQKTKFKVKQPLLSLQLKDQNENQRAPIFLVPSTVFLKIIWLPSHQVPLQISRHVELLNISQPLGHYWDLLLLRVAVQKEVGAWCPLCPSHPPCPCPCRHRCLGEGVNKSQLFPALAAGTLLHVCSNHTWQGFSSSYYPFVLIYYKA